MINEENQRHTNFEHCTSLNHYIVSLRAKLKIRQQLRHANRANIRQEVIMNNHLPFFERPDLSPYLVHLTRSSDEESGNSAFENLVSILLDGKIEGSTTKKGFIKGSNPATCFMDIPLSSLKYILNESNTDPANPRYEPYGIVVTKKNRLQKRLSPSNVPLKLRDESARN
jgi:hypothetical protein